MTTCCAENQFDCSQLPVSLDSHNGAIFNPQYTGAVVLETNTLSPAMKDVLLQRVHSSCIEDDASVIVI